MHIEATHKIYFTRDYFQFNLIKGNRNLNTKKIAKIIKDIESGFNMLPFCPIVVDEAMNVIDGQHRLQVAKTMQSNIWYVIADSATLHQIAKMNTNTERWKPADFINCYMANGVEDYKILHEFINKYKMPLHLTLKLLEKGVSIAGGADIILPRFESGEWKCNHLEKANELARIVYRFKDYKGFLKGNFITAIHAVILSNKCSIDDLITKFQKNYQPILSCISRKQFMNGLEQIYNHGNQQRRTIF